MGNSKSKSYGVEREEKKSGVEVRKISSGTKKESRLTMQLKEEAIQDLADAAARNSGEKSEKPTLSNLVENPPLNPPEETNSTQNEEQIKDDTKVDTTNSDENHVQPTDEVSKTSDNIENKAEVLQSFKFELEPIETEKVKSETDLSTPSNEEIEKEKQEILNEIEEAEESNISDFQTAEDPQSDQETPRLNEITPEKVEEVSDNESFQKIAEDFEEKVETQQEDIKHTIKQQTRSNLDDITIVEEQQPKSVEDEEKHKIEAELHAAVMGLGKNEDLQDIKVEENAAIPITTSAVDASKHEIAENEIKEEILIKNENKIEKQTVTFDKDRKDNEIQVCKKPEIEEKKQSEEVITEQRDVVLKEKEENDIIDNTNDGEHFIKEEISALVETNRKENKESDKEEEKSTEQQMPTIEEGSNVANSEVPGQQKPEDIKQENINQSTEISEPAKITNLKNEVKVDEQVQTTVINEEKEEIFKKVGNATIKNENIIEDAPIVEAEDQSEKSEDMDPNLKKIKEIEEETKVLKEKIIQFNGTSKSRDYLTLNEGLIKNMIKLDDLVVENEEIRNERKRVIKFIQEWLNTLERNVGNTKSGDDSDSDH